MIYKHLETEAEMSTPCNVLEVANPSYLEGNDFLFATGSEQHLSYTENKKRDPKIP